MNRRTFLGAAGGILALGAAGAAGAGVFADESEADQTPAEQSDGVDTATAAVTVGTLSTEREFNATVSFGDPWPVTTALAGTVTGSHSTGTVAEFGEDLVWVDNRRLTLAEGTLPMYRELTKVNTQLRDENGKRLTLQSGLDVTQLQAFLLSGNFDADGSLEVDGVYGGATEDAVEEWQKETGLPETGRVDSSQLVFSPHPLRIASELRVGSAFSGLDVNNGEASVLVDTSNRDRAALAPGTEALITLADGSVVGSSVVKQEQATAADGSRVWRSSLTVDAEVSGGASTAKVTVTEIVADDVLLVPASALLALAEGGFAVERMTSTGSELVRVDVGEVLDGRAEITGAVNDGDTVVIPT